MHKLMTSNGQCLPSNSGATDCFTAHIEYP